MSGGSFEYVSVAGEIDIVWKHVDSLHRLCDTLAEYEESEVAVAETMVFIDSIAKQEKSREQLEEELYCGRFRELRDVWQAVEWVENEDWSPDRVSVAIERHRTAFNERSKAVGREATQALFVDNVIHGLRGQIVLETKRLLEMRDAWLDTVRVGEAKEHEIPADLAKQVDRVCDAASRLGQYESDPQERHGEQGLIHRLLAIESAAREVRSKRNSVVTSFAKPFELNQELADAETRLNALLENESAG